MFEDGRRGPDDDFRLQFEGLGQFNADEKKITNALLDSLMLKHQADAGLPQNKEKPGRNRAECGGSSDCLVTLMIHVRNSMSGFPSAQQVGAR